MYTGHLFEEEVLGCCLKGWWNGEYVPFWRSLALVRCHQPWDPTDPRPRAANDLHACVAIALGVKDFRAVKLYTAVKNSPLDWFHGIDGFVEYRGVVVTIDLSLQNGKKNGYKADLILHESDLYTAEGQPNRTRLSEVGREIADLLLTRR